MPRDGEAHAYHRMAEVPFAGELARSDACGGGGGGALLTCDVGQGGAMDSCCGQVGSRTLLGFYENVTSPAWLASIGVNW